MYLCFDVWPRPRALAVPSPMRTVTSPKLFHGHGGSNISPSACGTFRLHCACCARPALLWSSSCRLPRRKWVGICFGAGFAPSHLGTAPTEYLTRSSVVPTHGVSVLRSLGLLEVWHAVATVACGDPKSCWTAAAPCRPQQVPATPWLRRPPRPPFRRPRQLRRPHRRVPSVAATPVSDGSKRPRKARPQGHKERQTTR